ncbi:hypothetical protein NC651_036283 [Populus alba x Populus x berolinensis]|nr:hypothetical protein NC651_036283 [Populus alba x Populus x berolinensis]
MSARQKRTSLQDLVEHLPGAQRTKDDTEDDAGHGAAMLLFKSHAKLNPVDLSNITSAGKLRMAFTFMAAFAHSTLAVRLIPPLSDIMYAQGEANCIGKDHLLTVKSPLPISSTATDSVPIKANRRNHGAHHRTSSTSLQHLSNKNSPKARRLPTTISNTELCQLFPICSPSSMKDSRAGWMEKPSKLIS